jgi:ligand-binding sensor domain-containing protein/signal transduction histidine kinase
MAVAVGTHGGSEPAGDELTPHYLADFWSTEEGLPSATVSAITQTRDGYLWCGTYDGVVRFDGVRFGRIGPDDSTNQQANRIQCLHVDRQGQLWIGTDGAGLMRYANGAFDVYAEHAGSSLNAVRSIAEDAAGYLWLGTRGGLGRFKDWRVEWFTESRGFSNASKSVWTVAFDQTGSLWVADWVNLKQFRDRQFETPPFATDIKVPVRAVYCDPAGGTWAGMAGRALRRDAEGTWVEVPDDGLFANVEVTAFCKTRSDELWVGTRKGLCRRTSDGKWRIYNPPDRPLNSDVRALFEDREGNLWVGTGSSGLVRLKRRVVRTYSAENGIPDGPVFGVCEKPDGGVWLGLNNGHVVESTDAHFQRFQRLPGIPGDTPIKCILSSRNGALWIGTFGNGLFRVKDGTPTRLAPTVGSPARIDRITALLEDHTGAVWVGSYYSLYKTSGGSDMVVPVMVAGREVRAPVVALLQDRAGTMWIGWEGFGISRLFGDRVMWLTRGEGLPSHFIRAFYEDEAGVIWIGTTSGLCFWRDGKVRTLTKAHGLLDNSIHQILEDNEQNLWLGSSRGIMRVARSELLAVAEGRKNGLEVFACGQGEGVLNEYCSGGFSPAGVKTKDGKLCFPTARGLVVVDPRHLNLTMNTNAPSVYIEEVRADGKVVAQPFSSPGNSSSVDPADHAPAPLALATGTRRLEFVYTAPCLSAPERVHFRYRLEGFDPDWTDAGAARSAVFGNVSPGHYRFQVLACNAAGAWNEIGHALSFRIAAPFWQTWWFLTLAAVASAGVLGGGVRVVAVRHLRRRLRRLEEAHAIEKERMRIAQDMHDEIGGKLSRISFLSDMARHNVPSNSKAGEQIEEVSEAAREVIRTVDEIVWAVSPRNDTLESVVHYICRHAEEFFELTPVELQLKLPHEFPDIRFSAEVRHNLFCAVKEALNNVLKHSDATRVRIAFAVSPASFIVTLADNGRGFDSDHRLGVTAAPNGRVGNGLLNMQERLQSVNGTFELRTQPGQGTEAKFELPLK